ncbi:MAG: Fe-S cluster assembly ATPase SufC [Candidatus Sungbacteria bacterium]|nr:Fe-S cluster assembly ATPase SufC [Candidatus Sungbacteria bacterium]
MQAKTNLVIRNLSLAISGKTVLSNVGIDIRSREIHALMGPNGSGKSSFAYAIAGHPEYAITNGSIALGSTNLLTLSPEKRAQAGLFLSFQEPPEVGGVSMATFLRMIAPTPEDNTQHTKGILCQIGLQDSFLSRFLNEGFSGGEKKKSELLQLVARKPKFAICDEIDSGLDLDALRSVANILRSQTKRGAGLLLISHSPRLFELIQPDFVHVLLKGKLVASGGTEVLERLEKAGYKKFEEEYL